MFIKLESTITSIECCRSKSLILPLQILEVISQCFDREKKFTSKYTYLKSILTSFAKFIHWNIYKKNETQLARNLLSLHIKVWIATILSYFFLYNVVIPNNRILSENIIVNKIDIKAPKFAHLVIKIKIIFLPLF